MQIIIASLLLVIGLGLGNAFAAESSSFTREQTLELENIELKFANLTRSANELKERETALLKEMGAHFDSNGQLVKNEQPKPAAAPKKEAKK